MLAINKKGRGRGGRGSNQYTVKPSGIVDDDEMAARVSRMKDELAVPSSSSDGSLRSSNPSLESKLRQARLLEQRSQDASEVKDEVRRSYPESYSSALLDDRSGSNPLYADATGEDDLDVDEMEQEIVSRRADDDESKTEAEGKGRQARFTALLMVSNREPDSMDEHAKEMNSVRRKMNIDFMARLAL